MKELISCAIAGALLGLTCSGADAQKSSNTLPPPSVRPAIEGVLEAFKTHPLVGIKNREGADNHDLAQQEDFYAALVRDPRFAREVGNIVVEFGGSSAQPIVDRYLDGQNVPYTELRKVWTDTLGWSPPPIDLGYVNLFAQIRSTNRSLPPERRIHVWLGEPPVNWPSVKRAEDISPTGVRNIMWIRDSYAADLIERQILNPGRKALVIYGGFHFLTEPFLLGTMPPGQTTMAALVERKHPGAIFTIHTYVGTFTNKACVAEFEKDKANLPAPILLSPVHGTTLADASFHRRCALFSIPLPPFLPKEKASEATDRWRRELAGLNDKAWLYLGPAASLTESPVMPDAYLDADYLKEIMRRARIKGQDKATPDGLGITVEKNTASPRPFLDPLKDYQPRGNGR